MDLFQKFYDRTLRFLSYRPRSEKEIKDYLLRYSGKPHRTRRIQNQILKQVQDDITDSGQARMTVIEQVIDKLKEQDLVNDEEFTKWWVKQRTNFRPRGIRVIKMELRQKGINQEIIEKIISNDQFQISNEEAAKKLVEKRVERLVGLPKKELYKKLTEFLLRRGFDWEIVKNAVDGVLGK